MESSIELPLPPPPTEDNIAELESNLQLPLPSPPKFDQLPEEPLLSPTLEDQPKSKKKLTWKKIQKENQKPKKKRKSNQSNQKRRKVPNLPDPDSNCNYEVVPGERENAHLYAMDGFLYIKNCVRLKQAFFK